MNCVNDHHIDTDKNEICNFPTICINCKCHNLDYTKHNSLSKRCPIFLKEKEIQAIKIIHKVDIKTSRQMFNQRINHSSIFSAHRTTTIYNSPNLSNNNNQQSKLDNNTNQHNGSPLPSPQPSQTHLINSSQLATEITKKRKYQLKIMMTLIIYYMTNFNVLCTLLS